MFVLRVAVERDGEVKGGDFVGVPFVARAGFKAPEGFVAQWGEFALHKPATALAVARLIKHGVFDPEDDKQRAVLVRGVRTICGLREEFSGGIHAVVRSVGKTGETNKRRGSKLGEAHRPLAYRIFRWYLKTTGNDGVTDHILSRKMWDELKAKSIETAAEMYA